MKRTPKGILRHKEIISIMASQAFDAICEKYPNKISTEDDRSILSVLKSHVKCVRRGATVTYTLIVPEINQTFVRKEPTALEFEGK